MEESQFSLRLPKKIYNLDGVIIGNKKYNLDLLLDKQSRIYTEHISSLNKINYKLASAKEFIAIVTCLFDNKNSEYKKEVEILRKNLKNIIRTDYPFMATGFEYNVDGKKDKIIDNYQLLNQKIEKVDLVGPNGFITELKKEEKLLERLLGTKEIIKVDESFSWLNDSEKGLYLWRLNEKPDEKIIAVARFFADSDRAWFYCYRYPSYSDSSLGVRIVSAKNF